VLQINMTIPLAVSVFRAFLHFGFLYGYAAGALAAKFVQLENSSMNQSDVNLGKLAVLSGLT
jgi:hypothetical protein